MTQEQAVIETPEKHYLCGVVLSSSMKNTDFPTITTVVQAEPWEEGHVARVVSLRFNTHCPEQHKKNVVNKNAL